MKYNSLREELKQYYWYEADKKADYFADECFKILDNSDFKKMNPYQMKIFQYKTITDMFEPVIFDNSPFYFETGTMCATCDGAFFWDKTKLAKDAPENSDHIHPGGWTYVKNKHRFVDQNPELWEKRCAQIAEIFYLICGPYNDVAQHFNLNYRPVFETGLKGVYERAVEQSKNAETDEEKDFLSAVAEGMLQLKKMSEKFGKAAEKRLKNATDENVRNNLRLIAETAKRVPWEKPDSFYSALNFLAFFRKTVGSLEGIGPNTFGRIDVDLYPFYKHDIENGIITKAEAYDLICKFLLGFDCIYDHDKKMVGYSDHEFENTYVLGGCDKDGKPVFNELTKLFLLAAENEKIIFPKIICRFSKNSPKEYLDLIDRPVINGTSVILYENDDAIIPALIKAGRPIGEARDYLVSGCWDVTDNGYGKHDGGSYVNLSKVLEFSVHDLKERREKTGLDFKLFDGADNFDKVYNTMCENIFALLKERMRITAGGGRIWNKVSPLPIFSSTMGDCIKNKKDYTAGGGKYRDDLLKFFGFPIVVDSLMAIKQLVFETKKYTLDEFLNAVRNNWKDNENMRIDAIHCNGWGDGSAASCELASRLQNDLFDMCGRLTGTYGGRVLMGHFGYTELRFWGEKTLATPDGRYNGDYLAQGLTPSRLKKIPFATDVINSISALDKTTMAGGCVVNIILPSDRIDTDICEGFIRTVADSSVGSLQLNCTTKEQLLDAQKHPEKYPDLIVRVCGFSARFTALSPEWQQEVLTRNYYR